MIPAGPYVPETGLGRLAESKGVTLPRSRNKTNPSHNRSRLTWQSWYTDSVWDTAPYRLLSQSTERSRKSILEASPLTVHPLMRMPPSAWCSSVLISQRRRRRNRPMLAVHSYRCICTGSASCGLTALQSTKDLLGLRSAVHMHTREFKSFLPRYARRPTGLAYTAIKNVVCNVGGLWSLTLW